MKHYTAVMSLLILFVMNSQLEAKCLLVLVHAQGDIVGQIEAGDVLQFAFTYSPQRIEISSPQSVNDKKFALEGAYSTYKRRGIFHGDVCGAAPHAIQLVMRNRNGAILDTVNLTIPDERATAGAELSYGQKQTIVLRRSGQPH